MQNTREENTAISLAEKLNRGLDAAQTESALKTRMDVVDIPGYGGMVIEAYYDWATEHLVVNLSGRDPVSAISRHEIMHRIEGTAEYDCIAQTLFFSNY